MTSNRELIATIGKGNLFAFLANFITLILVALLIGRFLPSPIFILWFLVTSAVLSLRYYFGRRMVLLSAENHRRHVIEFVVVLGLTGLCWGSTGILAVFYGSMLDQLVLLIMFTGVVGGSVSTLSGHYPSFVIFAASMMLPHALAFALYQGDLGTVYGLPINIFLLCIVVLFTILISGAAHSTYGTMLRSEQLMEQLRQTRDKAEIANQSKTHFLSCMSHDLRTPLHAIMGYTQLLEMDEKLNGEQREQTEQILKASQHLLSLLNQVLELSKIEAGEVSLDLEYGELSELLKNCEKLMQPFSRRHNVSLKLTPSSINYGFVSDWVKLKQILLNLISNAIKYNTANGTVDVEIIGLKGGKVKVQVRDNGIGIPLERQSELFQSFNRLGQEMSGAEGTGIGLVISRELLAQLGGKLEFRSQPGVGSTFWIELDSDHFTKDNPSAKPAELKNTAMREIVSN